MRVKSAYEVLTEKIDRLERRVFELERAAYLRSPRIDGPMAGQRMKFPVAEALLRLAQTLGLTVEMGDEFNSRTDEFSTELRFNLRKIEPK